MSYTEVGWFFSSMCYVDVFIYVRMECLCVWGLHWLGVTLCVCVCAGSGRRVVLRKSSGIGACLPCLAPSTPTYTAVYHTIQSCHRVTHTRVHTHTQKQDQVQPQPPLQPSSRHWTASRTFFRWKKWFEMGMKSSHKLHIRQQTALHYIQADTLLFCWAVHRLPAIG